MLRICNCELKEERQSEFKQVEITVLTTSLSGEGKEKEREWRDWVKYGHIMCFVFCPFWLGNDTK